MVIDVRTWHYPSLKDDLSDDEWERREGEWKAKRRRVFVDGVEINQVFYVDTDAGFVRTHDILGDNKAHSSDEISMGIIAIPEGEIWELMKDRALFKTIRGHIELKPFEEPG